MLSSLVKEHQAKQASRKEKQGLCCHLILKHRGQFNSVFAWFHLRNICAFSWYAINVSEYPLKFGVIVTLLLVLLRLGIRFRNAAR